MPSMMQHDKAIVEFKYDPASISVDSATMSFAGYGAVFGNVDSVGDVIAPGAFSQFIDEVEEGKTSWPAMLSQHGGTMQTSQDMTPVGLWTMLREDSTGLYVEGKFANTPRGQELYELMKMKPRSAIDGLSIGYQAKDWKSRSLPSDPKRLLKRIHLLEISPVTFPANSAARVSSVKSFCDMTARELEQSLRDVGLSLSEAKALMSGGFKSLKTLREVEDDEALGMHSELAQMIRANIHRIQA